jgi:hypothetical protein
MYSINVTQIMHHCELPILDKHQTRNMDRTKELRTLRRKAPGRKNGQNERVRNIKTNSAEDWP